MTRYLIVAPLVLLPAVAWAETTFEAGLLVGGHVFSDSSELGVADADGQQSLKSFAGGGGRMGLALGQRLVLEGEAMVVPTKTSPGDAGATMIGLTRSDSWNMVLLARFPCHPGHTGAGRRLVFGDQASVSPLSQNRMSGPG